MEDENLKEKFVEIKSAIENSKVILLAGHVDPDGDSLGSTLGMGRAIDQNTEARVVLYCADEPPEYLKFLPQISRITSDIDEVPDTIIGFDYGDFHRLGLPEEKTKDVNIITFDHHPVSGQVGELQIVETGFSSTCEIVYEFIKHSGWGIDKNIALSLLTGIVTDTGGLAYNTFADTYRVVGELMEKGVSMKEVYEKTFSNKSERVLSVCGRFLQNMVFDENNKFAAIFIPFEEFKKCGISYDDLKNELISSLTAIEEAKFALLLIEQESGKIKGSLRSDKFDDIDVSQIAKQMGGGGHKYAAAFVAEGSFKEIKEKVLDAINTSFANAK